MSGYLDYLLDVCVLQQITCVTEHGQCIHRKVTVNAAKTLPTLGLINGDDLARVHKRKRNHCKRQRGFEAGQTQQMTTVVDI